MEDDIDLGHAIWEEGYQKGLKKGYRKGYKKGGSPRSDSSGCTCFQNAGRGFRNLC